MVDTDGLKTLISNVNYLIDRALSKGSANKEDLEQLAANVEELYDEVILVQSGVRDSATVLQMLRRIKDLALEALIRLLKRGIS